MSESQVQVHLDGITVNCTTQEIAATFSWLLVEMRDAMPRLRPVERKVLRWIMSKKSGTLTVSDVFPDFTRESEEHKTLRRLRAAQFIRPAKTGRWEANESIELKPFGLLIWNQCGEASLFNDCTVSRPISNVAGDDDVVLDLASPDVNLLEQNANEFTMDENVAQSDDDLLDLIVSSNGKMNR